MSYDGDYGDDYLDMDDAGWIYVEDDYSLEDELAENQIASPGYSGTQYDIDIENFDFDLFNYYDDLEYGDDTYWDYFSLGAVTGDKRKKVAPKVTQSKRQKTAATTDTLDRPHEPTMFRSREERNRALTRQAPVLSRKEKYAFMADWRKRFAKADGIVHGTMPASMRKAAEARSQDTPQKMGRADADADADVCVGEGGDEEWEDDEEDAEAGAEGVFAIDPDMLKTILKQKLGDAGLDGMDEEAFMHTINTMLSGEGDGEEAAGLLANSLLGQVTSDTGNEALSGWLSQQGVSIQDNADDDASSVATADQQDSSSHASASQQRKLGSPPDSAVSGIHKAAASSQQTESPTNPSKRKRMASQQSEQPRKASKTVSFDVPAGESQEGKTAANDADSDEAEELKSNARKGITKSGSSSGTSDIPTAAGTPPPPVVTAPISGGKITRKRKATSAEMLDDKPAEKKTKSRELQSLDAVPATPSPGPPARRTRAAKAKKGEK